MNEGAIFIIGIIIFAITVSGTVMAGGVALTKAAIEQESQRKPEFQDGQPALSIPSSFSDLLPRSQRPDAGHDRQHLRRASLECTPGIAESPSRTSGSPAL